MKKYLPIVGLTIIVLSIVGIYQYRQQTEAVLGANQMLLAARVLGGTTTKLYEVPTSTPNLADSGFYQGDSTTTLVISATEAARTWQQLLTLNGINKVRLNIIARGGTGTSTLYIRPMVSSDGTNYYFPQSPILSEFVTTTLISASSTLTNTKLTFTFIPGTTTSTVSYLMNFAPAKFVRLMILGDDVVLDPNDGVKAYIEAEMQESQ